MAMLQVARVDTPPTPVVTIDQTEIIDADEQSYMWYLRHQINAKPHSGFYEPNVKKVVHEYVINPSHIKFIIGKTIRYVNMDIIRKMHPNCMYAIDFSDKALISDLYVDFGVFKTFTATIDRHYMLATYIVDFLISGEWNPKIRTLISNENMEKVCAYLTVPSVNKSIANKVEESDELKSKEADIEVEEIEEVEIEYIDDDADTYIPTDQELEDAAWGTPIETPRMISESISYWKIEYQMQQLVENDLYDQDNYDRDITN